MSTTKTKGKSKSVGARGVPPFHAKGVYVWRFTPVSWLATCLLVRPSRFQWPTTLLRRLQLRGSMGFAPTSRTREPNNWQRTEFEFNPEVFDCQFKAEAPF